MTISFKVHSMYPKLVAIAGSLKGATVSLGPGVMTIGRDISSDVVVSDSAVSRRHTSITLDETGSCRIADLDSANGTLVNGVPVRDVVLKEGDVIQVGACLFLFVLPQPEPPIASPEGPEDPELGIHSTVRLRQEDAVYLQPERSGGSSLDGTLQNLKALLSISNSVNSMRDVSAVEQRLLDHIFEVIPAERGAILLTGSVSEEFISSTYRHRQPPSSHPSVSRTVSYQVLHEGVGMLINAIAEPGGFKPTESLIAPRVTSLLCVPIWFKEKKLGVIYVDTNQPSARFDETHLQLLTGIAAIAGVALEQISYVEWLKGETERLQEEISVRHEMVGDSPRIRQVYEFINRVCTIDSTVLIRGESGTGKELVARAIHKNSQRKGMPFVAINCAALTETILESELFGHERGAFTGAVTQKKGKIEIADGGTLFLDEVSELSTQAQAKLLRVVQEREFERVGGTRTIKVNVRIVAATNRNLEEASKDGAFRQDLYYRLNVVSVTLPPLRERREDIPLLAVYFLHRYARECKRAVTGFEPEAMTLLKESNWPGNIRELQNAIERAVALGSSNRIRPDDLRENVAEESSASLYVDENSASYDSPATLIDAERRHILKVLEETGWVISGPAGAAARLGLKRTTLQSKIRKLGIGRRRTE